MLETEQTTLRLLGDMGAFGGLALALALGALAWGLYWRESRLRPGVSRWLLPSLRALAVMLVVLILTGPVMRHERTVRELGRVTVLIDASRSMQLADPGIPTARKVALLANMRRLPDEPFFVSARESTKLLREARDQAAAVLRTGMDRESSYLRDGLLEFIELLEKAQPGFFRVMRDAYAHDENGVAGERSAEQISSTFLSSLMQPARDLAQAAHDAGGEDELRSLLRQLRQLNEHLVIALGEVELAVGAHVDHRTRDPRNEGDRLLAAALREFDLTMRWQRLEMLLLDEDHGLLPELRKTQDVDLVALVGSATESLWRQGHAGEQAARHLPGELGVLPVAGVTDLSQTLVGALEGEFRNRAVILLSDGQHNAEGNPEETGRQLGGLGVPLFVIGMGAEEWPPDLAITEVLVPQGIYLEDQLRGEIVLNDQMPAGGAYEVIIENKGELIWEDFFQAEGSGEQRLEFRFPVRALVEAELAADPLRGASLRNLPLEFRVVARQLGIEQDGGMDPARVETILENNERTFRVQVLARKRRVLLLDGRPRWESRYLQNLFERDERWDVNALLEVLDPRTDRVWQRGDVVGQFPTSREELLSYDLIVFGDVPGDALTSEEAQWIADFVGLRGGGLVFIDGQRGFLTKQQHNPLVDLMPVEPLAHSPQDGGMPKTLALTSGGMNELALRIDNRPGKNTATWESLPPPRWVAPVRALPDAETLAQAVYEDGRSVDSLVWRRYGSGRVLYLGFDESWRWRFDVEDQYYSAFWVQVANWISEPPFAVEGPRVSIATDQLGYEEGNHAQLRVRLRDEDGRLVDNANLWAVFLLNDVEATRIELEPDPGGGGIYRGRTGRLVPGDYEVRILEAGREPFESSMSFQVLKQRDVEMEELTMNKALLRMVSDKSGGEFLLEENASEVLDRLARIDRRETITRDILLWSSYWWFVPVILLLTIEWIIRKTAGYV